MSTLRKEFADVVAEFKDPAHKDEALDVKLSHIVGESMDVVAVVYKRLDAEDREADLTAFKDEVEELFTDGIKVVLADRPVLRRTAAAGAGFAADAVVDFLAEHTGPVETFVDEQVLPRLRRHYELVGKLIAQLEKRKPNPDLLAGG